MLKLTGEVIFVQVLYIDVFFLINLTVDLLAAFFAVRLLHIPSSIARLLLLSGLGAVSAVIDVFLADFPFFRALNSALFLIVTALAVSKVISIARRIKFLLVFLVIELLLGGIVYYSYGLLDRYFDGLSEYFTSGEENRGALLVSLLILLAIGVLKLLIMIFSSQATVRVVGIDIKICEYSISTDALVDSGNLVKDPMNMNPVIFIKPELARSFLPREITELSSLDLLAGELRRRVRLVPVSRGGKTHIMTGVRPDAVEVTLDRRREFIEVTVVIDREGGKFGGYDALVPLDAVAHV